jgi:hypothetical protein
VFNDPITGAPIMPVPQAPKLDPDAAMQQINLGTVQAAALQGPPRAADTLVVTAGDEPVAQPNLGPPAEVPADIAALIADINTAPELPLDAFEAPQRRRGTLRSKKA